MSNPQAWGKGLNYYNLQDPTGDAFSDMFVNPSNDRRQQSAYTQDYKNFNYGLEQLKRTNPERYRQYLSVMQSGVNKTGNATPSDTDTLLVSQAGATEGEGLGGEVNISFAPLS